MNDIIIINDEITLKKEEKAELYIKVFWEEPRNEWYTCPDCKTTFWLSEITRNEIKQCLCWGDLKNYYDNNEIQNDWTKRANKEWYIWKLAQTLDNDFIWFMMGRKDNIDNLNQEKLWLESENLTSLQEEIKAVYPDFDLNNFFYVAEVGVKKDYRSKKIASRLFNKATQEAKENGYKYILLRTTTKEWWPYQWRTNIGYKIIFSYNDENQRVIMAKEC